MMADLDEAFGQDVQQEAAQELDGRERDGAGAASAEGDAASVEGEQAMVGEADAMSVATEVAKNVLRAAERWFGVNDPALSVELIAESAEAMSCQPGWQAKLAASVGLAQSREKLAAEKPAENANGKQEIFARTEPALTVERQATTGHDAMNVGMKQKLAGPGVQHARDAKLGAEPTWVTSELEQRFGRAGEEHVEEQRTVAERDWTQLGRQGEDDVEGMSGQDTLHTPLEPASLSKALALGTMSIAAGVVGDLGKSACVTYIEMAAERGGPATRDGVEDSALLGGEGVRTRERLAVSADDVRNLDGRSARAALAWRRVLVREHRALADGLLLLGAQHVQGARGLSQVTLRDARVAQCRADGGMTEQGLDDSKVRAQFQ